MSRLALLIWIVAAPTLMGILVVVALIAPPFMGNQAFWIPTMAGIGAAVAAPLSYVVAKMIKSNIGHEA